MAALGCSTLDYFPENVLIDILSYLNVRELVRNSRVCRRWKQLVKDQRLWRAVDLCTWKGMTSRVLWVLLRQYLGHGLRCLRLRGLLLSVRRGAFLTESWLQALRSKCPRLRRLYLQHTDLRGLHSCRLLPPSLQVLELSFCEVPPGFFAQDPETDGKASTSAVAIETLVLNKVPSFSDQHLRSLCTWKQLSRLELGDLSRVSAGGLRSCVPPGAQTLGRLKHLELETWSMKQMVALGLGKGWPGLERLTLGGNEVIPGLLSVSRLQDLRWLRLRKCRLNQNMVLKCCRSLTQLRVLEFSEVEIVDDEEVKPDETDEQQSSEDDPVPNLRRALCSLLPECSVCFSSCTLTINRDASH
ncbi:F-box/LRR-repeat protein 12 [Labeo rohita]|uniref:F-box/LRR-repeat protein 12 n=1 Tax=Labeo rohita TaxID=84645 RepID=A0ABQ8M192_LABRO|nr:F-box/LRR-repeat protein 12 [Labeo rohita]KAI2656660.1 F-box/LRR-repeat protein 12 [Labeo rohita]